MMLFFVKNAVFIWWFGFFAVSLQCQNKKLTIKLFAVMKKIVFIVENLKVAFDSFVNEYAHQLSIGLFLLMFLFAFLWAVCVPLA